MLTADDISLCYGNKKVLNNVCLEIKKNEIIAFLGPNGSGKSTLLRCLAGLYKPASGKVNIDGDDFSRCERKKIARHIALLPQTPEAVNYISVRDLVARGRSPYQRMGWIQSKLDSEKIEWALDYMGLAALSGRQLNELSGGERQKAWIAMIIAQDTNYILLDEPANCLDIRSQWELLKTVSELRAKYKKTIVLVLHDINHALGIADRTFIFNKGRLYKEGKTEDVITPALIKDVYGINVKICRFAACRKPVVVPEI